MTKAVKFYSEAEEKWNIRTHVFGLLASIVGLVFLVVKASASNSAAALISVLTFGVSLIVLYAASSIYHAAKEEQRRARLRVFDHAAIYLLIAGTYTPFTMLVLEERLGWQVFGIVWGLAVVGILLKLFFTGKFNVLSTLIYVGMGWVIIFAINPLIDQFSYEGLFTLFLGGGFYTLGAVLYSIKRLPFNHAIFHVFVLLGSFSHYLSVYLFVL